MPNEPWPWRAVTRDSFLQSGPIDEVVSSGLVRNAQGARRLASLICIGMPEGFACTAHWSCPQPGHVLLDIKTDVGTYSQFFVLERNGEWQVLQDTMVLAPRYRGRGHAKSLMRNLVIAYDEIGVSYVSTVANDQRGGYVWAVLGASAREPHKQRDYVAKRLGQLVSDHTISKLEADDVIAYLNDFEDYEIMRRIAQLNFEGGVALGKLLLVGHTWDAFWDLRNDATRDHLREVLNDL